MPHKYTFQVAPLREIIDRYRKPEEVWIDPFAGEHSPVPFEWRNDLNPLMPAAHHLEAADFVELIKSRCGDDEGIDGAIFDPPYSVTQVSRSYQDIGLKFKGAENPTGGFPKVRDLLADLVLAGGYVISYGWNTVGMGKKRGFTPVEYLICSHGGNRNDTLVVVEQRL
jgi:hypothetical protein